MSTIPNAAEQAAIAATAIEAARRAEDLLAFRDYSTAEPFARARMRVANSGAIERGRALAASLPPPAAPAVPAPPPPPPGAPTREQLAAMDPWSAGRARLRFNLYTQEK
jgi:hypothetical protein